MKKIISKIALALVIISSMPVHASFGQTLQNGARTLLQDVGNNSGRIAAVVGGFFAAYAAINSYQIYRFDKTCMKALEDKPLKERNNDEKRNLSLLKRGLEDAYWIYPLSTAIISSITACSAYALAKVCGWAGSKI